MNYILAFEICTILITITLITVTIRKKHLDMYNHKFFLILCSIVFICSCSRLVTTYAIDRPELYGNTAAVAMSCVTMLVEITIPFVFSLYDYTTIDITLVSQKTVRSSLFMPMIGIGFAILLGLPSRMLFRIEDSALTVWPLGYAVGALSLSSMLASLIICRNYLNTLEKNIISSSVASAVLIFLAFITEMFFHQYFTPDILYALALMLLELFAVREEDYIDKVSQLPNTAAFRKIFAINMKTRDFNEVVILQIENIRLLNLTIGYAKVNEILRKVGDYLETLAPKGVYQLQLGTFALVPKLSPSQKEQFFADIKQRFHETWNTSGSEIIVSQRMMEIKVPTDADNADKIYTYADYLKHCNVTKDVMTASSVSLRDNSRILIVEECIKRAIENNSFKMYYQPIYSIKTGKMVSAEALIRLIDDQYGFISPAEFIPISEENGTILQIGKCVVEQVFGFISENNLENIGLDYVEVNLSVVQCMQNNLAQSIIETAKELGVESKRINLEITESAAAERPVMLMKNMNVLVNEMYTFSLDDFGTGYSNIGSIVDMPLEIIKFDKSIIDKAKTGSNGKILLESLAVMVKKMGKKIVAEGVETEEQFRELKEMGVDYIQGFYFSKPLPEDEFIRFIKEFNSKPQKTLA